MQNTHLLDLTKHPRFPAERVGVYVDLNCFRLASSYYHYCHPIRSWLDIAGVLDYALFCMQNESPAVGRYRIVCANAYIGGKDLVVQNGWTYTDVDRRFQDQVRQAGIKLRFGEYDGRKEVGVDAMLQTDLIQDALARKIDRAILISGDGDHAYAVGIAAGYGVPTALVSWRFPRCPQQLDGIGASEMLRQACALDISMEDVAAARSCRLPLLLRNLFRFYTASQAPRTVFQLGSPDPEAA
jgi:uncharacterized LabA/DUF88 family protein